VKETWSKSLAVLSSGSVYHVKHAIRGHVLAWVSDGGDWDSRSELRKMTFLFVAGRVYWL
jgi:hypothetical protein